MSELPKTFIKGFHDEELVRKMEYQELGNTGLEISKISLGGGTFSHFYGDLDETEGYKTIIRALKSGINYIDTAPWYGQGRSEEVYGQVLKSVPREGYYIGTKVGRYELDVKKQFDFSAEKTKQSVDRSLELLGLDYVDVIQIHDIEFAPNIDVVLSETLPALEDIKLAGKAKHIGVTGYPLDALKNAILGAPGRFETVLCYTRYSLVDNSLLDYLPIFKQEKVGVIIASIHGLGLLTNDGPQPWHPARDDLKKVCREAGDYCRENGVELGRLAVYHALQLKGYPTFLIGMQTQKLFEANMDVYYNGLKDHEKIILATIQEKFFSKVHPTNWEGIEVKRYWEQMMH